MDNRSDAEQLVDMENTLGWETGEDESDDEGNEGSYIHVTGHPTTLSKISDAIWAVLNGPVKFHDYSVSVKCHGIKPPTLTATKVMMRENNLKKRMPCGHSIVAWVESEQYCSACSVIEASRTADKLRILTDPTLTAKEALEKSGDYLGHEKRKGGERRFNERCECGHMKFWHMSDGKCLAGKILEVYPIKENEPICPCVEYLPQPDRRSK